MLALIFPQNEVSTTEKFMIKTERLTLAYDKWHSTQLKIARRSKQEAGKKAANIDNRTINPDNIEEMLAFIEGSSSASVGKKAKSAPAKEKSSTGKQKEKGDWKKRTPEKRLEGKKKGEEQDQQESKTSEKGEAAVAEGVPYHREAKASVSASSSTLIPQEKEEVKVPASNPWQDREGIRRIKGAHTEQNKEGKQESRPSTSAKGEKRPKLAPAKR
jgi:hypothetical protein